MKKALKFLSLAMMVLFTGALLTACVPSNVEKAKEKKRTKRQLKKGKFDKKTLQTTRTVLLQL